LLQTKVYNINCDFVADHLAQHHWLAASRMGQLNYTWCSSSQPFSLNGFKEMDLLRKTDPLNYLLSVKMGSDMTRTSIANELSSAYCRSLCKPWSMVKIEREKAIFEFRQCKYFSIKIFVHQSVSLIFFNVHLIHLFWHKLERGENWSVILYSKSIYLVCSILNIKSYWLTVW